MQSSSQSAPITPEPCAIGPEQPRKREKRDDLAYQAVTVAVILLVLGSLWLF